MYDQLKILVDLYDKKLSNMYYFYIWPVYIYTNVFELFFMFKRKGFGDLFIYPDL